MSEHAFFNPSSADAWSTCPRWTFKKALAPDASVSSSYSAEGKLAHSTCEDVTLLAGDDLDEFDFDLLLGNGVSREMVQCALEFEGYVRDMIGGDEVVLDLIEARVRLSPLVWGTADRIIITRPPEGGVILHVFDYKYGAGVRVRAVGNKQMLLYAAAAVEQSTGLTDVCTVALHIVQPRMRNFYTWTLDREALAVALLPLGMAATVADAIRRAALDGGNEPGGVPSEKACQFCPFTLDCPVNINAVSKVLATTSAFMDVDVDIETPKGRGDLLSIAETVRAWGTKTVAAVKDRALRGYAVTGHRLVLGRGRRTWTEGADAQASLLEDTGMAKRFDLLLDPALRSPAQMEKTLGRDKTEELMGDFITKTAGKPTLVDENDPRSTFVPNTGDDFSESD